MPDERKTKNMYYTKQCEQTKVLFLTDLHVSVFVR